MSRSAFFWNLIAGFYSNKPVPDETVYQRKLELTRERLSPDARVLELGCGTGSTALALAPFAGSVTAIDYSSRMIEIAREKTANSDYVNVKFKCGAINDFDFDGERFDAVLAHSLLHLLDNWEDVVRKSARLLEPGGVLVISTMCMEGQQIFLRLLGGFGKLTGLLPGLAFFSRKQLDACLADAGLTVEYDWMPSPQAGWFIIARKADRADEN